MYINQIRTFDARDYTGSVNSTHNEVTENFARLIILNFDLVELCSCATQASIHIRRKSHVPRRLMLGLKGLFDNLQSDVLLIGKKILARFTG